MNEELVAVGDSPYEVESKAREISPEKIPSVFHVPMEEELAYLL